jgi:NADP-dependent 3-hydroxy acid dehydrogenase YdfG
VNQSNQYALVSGATAGIGREITVGLIQNGFHVLAVGRRAKALEELKQEFPDLAHSQSWASSPEYQSLIPIRSEAMKLTLFSVTT